MKTIPVQQPMKFGQDQARIFTYLILNITSGTVGGAMQLLVPLYALSLKAALSQVGLIRGVSGLGILVLVIPGGFLVDHYGSKRLFLIGALCGTVATYCLTFATKPAGIAIIMGLAGLLSSLKMIALNSSFYDNLQAMGIEKAGWFKGSMSIGLTFIGPLFGAFLLRTMSYHLLFKLLALMTLVPIALVFFFHEEPVRHKPANEFKQAIFKQLGDFRQLIRRRELYLPLFTESISTSFFSTFSAFIVVLVVQSLHLPVTTASLLLTIEGGLFIVTVFAAGPLLKRFSQAQLYWVSVSIVIAGLIYLALAISFVSLAGSAVVLGLGLGLINLVTSARIGQLKGEKGKIMGLFSAAIGVGISIGPMAGGAIGSWLGTRAIFLAFLPLFLALAIAASWVERRGHLAPASDTDGNSELPVDTDELATSI